MMSEIKKIGTIGAGKMGCSLLSALIRSGKYENLYVFDPYVKKEDQEQLVGAEFVTSVKELEEKSDILLLCVKPKDMKDALEPLQGDKYYISIAAGISLATLSSYLKVPSSHVARVMPNLAAQIGLSITAVFCHNPSLTKWTEEIFAHAGTTLGLAHEEEFHAFTALAGSGPALIASIVHALAEGGVLSGIDYSRSLFLVQKTLEGSLALLQDKQIMPSELRKQTASPKGTTIEALHVLEKHGLHGILMSAVKAASERSREIERSF